MSLAVKKQLSTCLGSVQLLTVIFIVGCAGGPPPCEEILEVKRQHMECSRLKEIMQKDDYPQQALTAKKRFEEACLDLRYYRDDYDTICKRNEEPIGRQLPRPQPPKDQ